MDAFGYDISDFIPSEISGMKAVDINHIECKGMGGNPTGELDRIENLQAVTRKEHEFYGDKKLHMAFLYRRHYEFMDASGVKFDKEYMLDQIEKYEHQEVIQAN